MAQRVFVNVVGFTDEERHALNLLFRISEEHEVAFCPWEPTAPDTARLSIVDGQNELARGGLWPLAAEVPLFWVGPGAPEHACRVFQRPIAWPKVVEAMDELFPAPLDFDLDFDAVDTLPPPDGSTPLPPQRRVLIASERLEDRLYLRARLALAGLPFADEAGTAERALEFARATDYVLAMIDIHLPGADGWLFVRELRAGPRAIPKVIVTASHPTLLDKVRSKFAPVAGFFEKPPHPARLHQLLQQV